VVHALLLPFLAIFLVQLLLFLFGSAEGGRGASAGGRVRRLRWRLAGILALAAGLISAALVYRHTGLAPEDDGDAIGYEVGPGYSYPILPGSTKRAAVQLEQLGGKANVVAADFRAWGRSLWRGRRLAYTLAALSGAGGLACFLAARLVSG